VKASALSMLSKERKNEYIRPGVRLAADETTMLDPALRADETTMLVSRSSQRVV
jgi:hypothetical protein